jgi:23S rRNA (adenine2030-N6)-methyltransferase
MLSYRHAFHAGNHADVLKHFVQVQLHQYMNQKDTAYTYIDTHSGAGVYALDSNFASKNAEFDTGIGPLWSRTDLPPALAEYVDLVKGMNPSGKMRYYPGSPWVADQMTRPDDRLRLFELHPADSKILADNFRKAEAHKAEQGERTRGRRVMIERGDGFLSMKALLPPPSRRALVLIDPPYEMKDDYRKVKDALEEALGRFPTGMFAVWYPVLQRMESRQFADRLKRLPAKEWLNVTLTVSTPGPDGFGLHSSGMFILNPPYTLEPLLREVMPYLVKVLGKDAGASFVIERGTQVTGAATARVGAGGTARQPIGNARRASPLSGTGSLRLPGQAAVPRPEAASGDAKRPDGAAAAKVEAASRAKRFSRSDAPRADERFDPARSPTGDAGKAPRARYADERPKVPGARPERAVGAGPTTGRPTAGRPTSGRPTAGQPAAGTGPARPRKRG